MADISVVSAAVCRICHSGDTSLPYMGGSGVEQLISPCHCKGTMGLYHRSCLEHWLTISGTACCEICNFHFELRRKYLSFWYFMRSRGCFKGDEGSHGTLTDVAAFIVLTPFALSAASLCVYSGWNATTENGLWNPAEGVTMFVMALFLLLICGMWIAVTAVYYHHEYKAWRKKHVIIFIVDQLTADESLLYNGGGAAHESQVRLLPRKFVSVLVRPFANGFRRTRRSILEPSLGSLAEAIRDRERRERIRISATSSSRLAPRAHSLLSMMPRQPPLYLVDPQGFPPAPTIPAPLPPGAMNTLSRQREMRRASPALMQTFSTISSGASAGGGSSRSAATLGSRSSRSSGGSPGPSTSTSSCSPCSPCCIRSPHCLHHNRHRQPFPLPPRRHRDYPTPSPLSVRETSF